MLAREKFERDQLSLIEEATERGELKGELKGVRKGKLEVAQALIGLGMNREEVAKVSARPLSFFQVSSSRSTQSVSADGFCPQIAHCIWRRR
jgi:hypothetical protein